MKLYDDVDVGSASHTGRVRRSNEDDYLLIMPESRELLASRGRLVALADGMGGVTGGAEASRAAVRSVSQSFLADEAPDDAEDRMREGFERACRRVFELSRQSPSLRGMGTTLTVLNLLGNKAVLGHVGDTRCYRLRDGQITQLTEDHAVAGQENRLTRCIGGGRAEEQIDVVVLDVRPGDRYLLATDGLWDAVPAEDVRHVFGDLPPQHAADELVRLANAHGGLDNSTAVVVSVLRTSGDPGALREVRLPAEESPDVPVRLQSSRRLHAPRWPWVILTGSALLGGLAVAKMGGLDLLELVLEKFR